MEKDGVWWSEVRGYLLAAKEPDGDTTGYENEDSLLSTLLARKWCRRTRWASDTSPFTWKVHRVVLKVDHGS